MQICAEHWDQLRKAIADRGLEHLVGKSGQEAADSMVRQLEGTATEQDFDPLMNANWAITAAYVRDAGAGAILSARGNICPLCEVERSRKGLATNWIEGCTQDQLEIARTRKLVPGEQ